ncbi:MAG TPA: FHA domain-containing protein [Pirellulales bacterium]|nr:FHA domain-containing protein [Pirellulales bacterium]
MEAKLVVVGGKANKSEVKLKLPAMLGRGRDADVTVAHATVSRQHCLIYELDGALVVRDNGSLNGTVVDGERIKESVLKPGQSLTIGPLTFRADYEHSGEFPVLGDAPNGAAEANGAAKNAHAATKPSKPAVAAKPKEPAKPIAPAAEIEEELPAAKPAKSTSDEFDFLDEDEPAEAGAAKSGPSFSFLNDSGSNNHVAANGSADQEEADDDSAEVFRIADDPPAAAKPAEKKKAAAAPAQNKPASKGAAAKGNDESALNDFLNSLGLEE